MDSMEMPKVEIVADIDFRSSLKSTSSLIEQLGKAFVELEGWEDAPWDDVQWRDVEGHFHHLQSATKKKLEELEAKEKLLTERESLLAGRETAVSGKELDLLNRVQELQDAALADIMETKASCSFYDEKGGGYSPVRAATAERVAGELKEFCDRMDSKGLLNYVINSLNGVSSICRRQLSVVLGTAAEPARLVLDALEGFFPADGSDPPEGVRHSCLVLLEALSAFLAKADSSAVKNFLSPEIKQRAKAIAEDWKPKLALDSSDAIEGKLLEARAFLRFLFAFRIVSEFDKEELCNYALATAHHRQATDICRALDLTENVPGLVEKLIEKGQRIEAVNFILSFLLSEAFPPVPLLKAFLKEVRRDSQGNGVPHLQKVCNEQELGAIKAVMRCVKEYNLEAEIPLDPLRKRLMQLHNAVFDHTKRLREKSKRRLQRESLVIRGTLGSHVDVSDGSCQGHPLFSNKRAAHTGVAERHSVASPSANNYPVSGQSSYTAQANGHRNYTYPVPSQSTLAAQPNEQRNYSCPVATQSSHAAQLNDQRNYSYPVPLQSSRVAQPNDQSSYSYPVATQSDHVAQLNDQRPYDYPVPSQSILAAGTIDQRNYDHPIPSNTQVARTGDRGNYNYPVRSQSTHAAQAYNQPYYHGQDDRASVPYSAGAPTYGSYMQPSQPPYM